MKSVLFRKNCRFTWTCTLGPWPVACTVWCGGRGPWPRPPRPAGRTRWGHMRLPPSPGLPRRHRRPRRLRHRPLLRRPACGRGGRCDAAGEGGWRFCRRGVRTKQSPVGLLRKKWEFIYIFCMVGSYLFWPVEFLQVVKASALYQGVRTKQSPVGLLRRKESSFVSFVQLVPTYFGPWNFYS